MDEPGPDQVLFVDVETLQVWAKELKGLAGLVDANRELADEIASFGTDDRLVAATHLRGKHRDATALAASLVAYLEWLCDDLQVATEHAAKTYPGVDGHSAQALRALVDELGGGDKAGNEAV